MVLEARRRPDLRVQRPEQRQVGQARRPQGVGGGGGQAQGGGVGGELHDLIARQHAELHVRGQGRGVGGGPDTEGPAAPGLTLGPDLAQQGTADAGPLLLRVDPEAGEEPDVVPEDGAGQADRYPLGLGQAEAAGAQHVLVVGLGAARVFRAARPAQAAGQVVPGQGEEGGQGRDVGRPGGPVGHGSGHRRHPFRLNVLLTTLRFCRSPALAREKNLRLQI